MARPNSGVQNGERKIKQNKKVLSSIVEVDGIKFSMMRIDENPADDRYYQLAFAHIDDATGLCWNAEATVSRWVPEIIAETIFDGEYASYAKVETHPAGMTASLRMGYVGLAYSDVPKLEKKPTWSGFYLASLVVKYLSASGLWVKFTGASKDLISIYSKFVSKNGGYKSFVDNTEFWFPPTIVNNDVVGHLEFFNKVEFYHTENFKSLIRSFSNTYFEDNKNLYKAMGEVAEIGMLELKRKEEAEAEAEFEIEEIEPDFDEEFDDIDE